MRKIYLFDTDNGVLSIGESTVADRVSVRVSDGKNEAEVLLSREAFGDLCSLSYDIRWALAPTLERDPFAPPARQEVEEEVPF
jgi:hypothetical protein